MMSEIEQVEAAIRRCEQRRDQVSDAESKRYYELCLIGWRAELARANKKNDG